ncbi:glutamate receptor ionotropic, delta-2-like [Panulirus ornatus]|uniref:glutamate receptor ionotropic, delta-2-like n=1 Tax=Panulirus ornatus TaxID=150431 RepID=UPI003A838B46
MVGMVDRREADVGLGPFGFSKIRSLVVDFTRPILIDYMRIMGGRGRPEVDPWGFLLPLTPLVWAAILTTLLVVPTGVVLVSSTSTFRNTRKKTTDVFFAYMRVLLQEDYIVPAEWWLWERLVLGLWMMMTVVLTRSYEGNLMSLLAVRHIPQPYQSLRQVIDDPAVTMVWEPNTVYVEFYRLAKTGILREVAEMDRVGLIKYYRTTQFPYVVDTLVRPGDHVLVAEDLTEKVRMAQDFSNTGYYCITSGLHPASMK